MGYRHNCILSTPFYNFTFKLWLCNFNSFFVFHLNWYMHVLTVEKISGKKSNFYLLPFIWIQNLSGKNIIKINWSFKIFDRKLTYGYSFPLLNQTIHMLSCLVRWNHMIFFPFEIITTIHNLRISHRIRIRFYDIYYYHYLFLISYWNITINFILVSR